MAIMTIRNLMKSAVIASALGTTACTTTEMTATGTGINTAPTRSAPEIVSLPDSQDGGGCNVALYFDEANGATADNIAANPGQLENLANRAARNGKSFSDTCNKFARYMAENFGAAAAVEYIGKDRFGRPGEDHVVAITAKVASRDDLAQARAQGVQCDEGLRLSAIDNDSAREFTGICRAEETPADRPTPSKKSLGLNL